jgi:hypothetical protein
MIRIVVPKIMDPYPDPIFEIIPDPNPDQTSIFLDPYLDPDLTYTIIFFPSLDSISSQFNYGSVSGSRPANNVRSDRIRSHNTGMFGEMHIILCSRNIHCNLKANNFVGIVSSTVR